MRVGFNFDALHTKDAPDGKHKFLMRLAKQMNKMGVTIDNKTPDVFIRLPREKACKKAKVNILRVDGLIMNIRWNYKHKNKKIMESIGQSDAVVYQSKFCLDAYSKFLGINAKYKVIPNGASTDEFLPRKRKNFFLASSRWRPHKRLPQTTDAFMLAVGKGLDADLVVTGKPDKGDKRKHPRIKYTGWQNSKQLKKLLSKAIASIHLTWLDWCPNSMIEAIIAGTPLIYSKCGGHNNIAPGSGIGIDDVQWNWKKIDLYDPPKLDNKKIIKAMFELKENDPQYPLRKDLMIETVAQQYIDFGKELLKR